MTNGGAGIVNLNKARKARARDQARRDADANALRFGRTKGQRSADQAQADAASRHLDGHRRDDPPPGDKT